MSETTNIEKLHVRIVKLEKQCVWVKRVVMATFVIAFVAFAVLASHIVHDILAFKEVNKVLEEVKSR